MGGYCSSATSVASEEPKAKVSQLSYTDKLLIREKRDREVPRLAIASSAIYQRRGIYRENSGFRVESEEVDRDKPVL